MKTWAYRQDQLPSTHPIMAEINDLQDVQVNFDGITYAKGASVLKQLVAYVGMDAFFTGVQAYFKATPGKHPPDGPAGRPGGDLRPRPEDLVEEVAGDGGHQHPPPGDRDRRRRHDHLLRRAPGGPGTAGRRQGRVDPATAQFFQPSAGTGYELDTIAAVVIGGASLNGGVGGIRGTVVGVLIIGVLRNGLNLSGVSPFVQQIVIGGVIALAVAADTFRRRD